MTHDNMEFYLRQRAADALASLKKAGAEIEFVENLIKDALTAQAVLKARGRDPQAVRDFLKKLRETVVHVHDNFELQMLDN